jgi:predicted transcriptional regulator
VAIDFDWSWVYRLWKAKFGARAETLTVQTPNGGLRPHYLCEKPESVDRFKGSLFTELKGPGRFVVYEGKASREDGSLGEYKVVNDKPIREDNNIIIDTLTWLEEIQKRYHFLRWNCLRPHFSKKRLADPSHSVRLFLADIMVCDGFGDEEIFELYRDFQDFDYAKTEYQIRYTRKRVEAGLKPPTCETLKRTLGWSEENCRGCPRKGTVKQEEGILLGDYHLELRGSNAIVYDKAGQPVWSIRATSLTGYNVKKDLAKKLGLDESIVDRAVAQFMLSLRQKKEDRGVQQIEEGLKPIETTLPKEELQRRALELLRSPNLLFRVKTIYEKGVVADRYRFVLGEEDKKLLTFAIAASAKSSWPQSLWVTGTSGFGKSNLVVVTLALMPAGYAKVRSYLTGAGLRYGSQDYKVLFVREWRQFAERDIRLVSREDGSYTYEIAVRDPETNEWTTQVGEIPAKTIITTSAEKLPSAQMLRRCWLLSVDETPELTRLINIRKAEYRTGKVEPVSPDEIAVIQYAISLLQPADINIPYAELLVDLAPWDRTRLDYFLDIIAVVAWLHQYQRPKDSQGRIIALPADLYMAIRICWPTLMQSLLQLPERLKKCWKILPKDTEKDGKTTKQLALELGLSQSTVRQYLGDLINLNYAVSAEKQRSRGKQYWGVTAQTASAECAESVIQHLTWKEIASLTERTLKNVSPKDVLNGQGEPLLLIAYDPLTGVQQQLVPPSDSAHIPEDREKSLFDRKKTDLGFLGAE